MKKILFLICLFSISFYSCAIRDYYSSVGSLDENRTFYGQMIQNGNTTGGNWYNVPARLAKTTDNLAIYVQTKFLKGVNYDISLYALNKLAQEFDYYYGDITNIYGGHTDIDQNSKIIILLMDINYSKNGSQVLGYFNPLDMHGYNEGELLYVDISNANNSTDKTIGTMIHEFQHLINYSYVVSGARSEMDTWLNEALSESTSILFNKATAESRISEFTNINYYCFYTWTINESISNTNTKYANRLVNYPSASVFMNWLYHKNGKKSDIFRNIAFSRENGDYNKVLRAVNGSSTWENLLLDWMGDMVSNTYGSQGLNVSVNTWNGNVNLYPGAMIVCDSTNGDTKANIVTRTVKTNSQDKIIVLNRDATVGNNPTAVNTSVNSSINASMTSSRGRMMRSSIKSNNEENPTVNILLDRNGNIKEY